MNPSRPSLFPFMERMALWTLSCAVVLCVSGEARAFQQEEAEAIAGDHALVQAQYRTPSTERVWIVKRTTWPNPGLQRKIDPGVVVRVLESGIHHDGEWLRVQTVDEERTYGFAMAHLLVPAHNEQVRAALLDEQQGIRAALEEAERHRRQLVASAERAAAAARDLQRPSTIQPTIPAAPQAAEASPGLRLAAAAFESVVTTMREKHPPQKKTALSSPRAPRSSAVEEPSSPWPRAVQPARAPNRAPAPTLTQPLPASQPILAGATTPAQVASAPAAPGARALAPVRTAPPNQAQATAPLEAAAAQSPSLVGAPSEPVLAIGQADPRVGIEAARALPDVAWGRILLVIMLLAGIGAAAMYFNERRKEQSQELVTLSSVPLARDASLSLVKAPGRTLVVGTTPAGVHLVTDLAEDEAAGFQVQDFLRDHVAPSLAEASPAPLSRLLRDETQTPIATKPEPVRRLAAARKKVFGGHG